MTSEDQKVVLYIIMRGDLASLNPGKAMAQASHAYGAMMESVEGTDNEALFLEWQAQTSQLFGTTIVLIAKDWDEVGSILHAYTDTDLQRRYTVSGAVLDPEYPVRDGTATHHIPVYTCGFVFGRKNFAGHYLNDLPLHP